MKRLAIALLLATAPLSAQTAHEDLKALQDNSFLLEEAYNQGPGVVQHIGVFTLGDDDVWELSFTEEWPLGSMRHQISYDIPVNEDGFADVAVHYRYQLLGDGDSDLAITPRLTAILPTGDDSEAGVELGLPISRILAPRLATHTNLNVTWQDGAEFSIGQSLVYAVSPRVQGMLEAVYTNPQDGDSNLEIAPGIRWSYDRPSGLQIVPGVAVILGDEDAVLLYLSFEHPFRRVTDDP